MKIGIIGSGMVGATAAYAMVMRGVGREIVLIDRNRVRAKAEADDILHAVPFANPLNVHDGDYADLRGARVVVITAGTAQKPGETRLDLLQRNAAILKEIVENTLTHAPEAILLVTTNPVDIMTHLTARYAAAFGVPSARVIGSGTTLDTARFRALLGQYLGIDSYHVHAYVLGEHGDSEVLTWSLVAIGGMPLADFCGRRHLDLCEGDRQNIEDQVRNAAYHIISGKGATYYGVGSALARIADVILKDQRAILTVCTSQPDIAGVADVTASLPHLVGGGGILDTYPPLLDAAESAALHNSAQIIRTAMDELA